MALERRGRSAYGGQCMFGRLRLATAQDVERVLIPARAIGSDQSTKFVWVVTAEGTVIYTPDPGFQGTDEFPYTLTDGNNGRSNGLVTVTVGSNVRTTLRADSASAVTRSSVSQPTTTA